MPPSLNISAVECRQIRNISLFASAAKEWLRTHGWSTPSGANSELRVFGDLLNDQRISLSRIWTTASNLVSIPDSNDTRALLIVEGTATLACGAGHREVGPWDLITFARNTPVTLTTTGHLGFMQIDSHSPLLKSLRSRIMHAELFSDAATSQVLVAMTNATLNADLAGNSTGNALLAQALDRVISAIIARSENASEQAGAASTALDKAMRVIAARHVDPKFDVAALAQEIHLGRRQLCRVIARSGMTPAEVIRKFRLETAHSTADSLGQREPSAAIAQMAGFRDLRALRRAQQLDAM